MYPEWLQHKEKNKIVSLNVLFPETDFPRNLAIPMRRICTGGFISPHIPIQAGRHNWQMGPTTASCKSAAQVL